MNDLVERLSKGDHPVKLILEELDPIKDLMACLERNYINLLFTETKGGTELGFDLDKERSNWKDCNFIKNKGIIHLEGEIILNYNKVRIIADINIESLSGIGHLLFINEVNIGEEN